MIFVGIDPGKSGAVVAIKDTLELVYVADTPTLRGKKGREYDIPEMAAILRRATLGRPCEVIVERVHSMPSQGVASTFSFGMGYGIWLGLLGALELPYRQVRAADWVKRLLKGMPGDGKERAILFARQVFPTLDLVPPGCHAPRDGRADAACLAYYGAKCWQN
jgi:crossover junction endodeoxyribonuclease RuvC